MRLCHKETWSWADHDHSISIWWYSPRLLLEIRRRSKLELTNKAQGFDGPLNWTKSNLEVTEPKNWSREPNLISSCEWSYGIDSNLWGSSASILKVLKQYFPPEMMMWFSFSQIIAKASAVQWLRPQRKCIFREFECIFREMTAKIWCKSRKCSRCKKVQFICRVLWHWGWV